jgi:FKBP-type peptidyl-prolyl cis-trans isomerase SlyD
MDTISDGVVVIMHYTLTNDQGEVLDTSDGSEPLPYLHGANNIVPGLEKELTGLKAGDSKTVDVVPEEGYGVVNEDMIQQVPRDQFPEDAEVEPGVQFVMEADGGHNMPVWVTAVEEGMVTIDANHPLAGETLHFAVQIASLRAPTDDEKAHGHPHGLTGSETHH